MLSSRPIFILMATYQGERFVREQILSIQSQSIEHWRLLVRDDGSTDRSLEILEALAARDKRLTILPSGDSTHGGASENFNLLLQAGVDAGGQLFFLCDQDDVWEPDKLQRQMEQFPEQGAENFPLLVHSDLAVVNDRLESIHSSLMAYMALEPRIEEPLNYLLSRNFVTGCATACNRQLLVNALPIARTAIMHDWWLALVAAATGELRFIDAPLVKYRQHDANQLGARGFWHGLNPTNSWIRGWRRGNCEFLATFDQVEALRQQASRVGLWPERSLARLDAYAGLLNLPKVQRPGAARNLRVRQGSSLLQMIYTLRLLSISVPRDG